MTPPPPRWRAVLFDLDGTLVDSLQDVTGSLNHTLDTLGRPARDLAWVRAHIGRGAAFLLDSALGAEAGAALGERALDEFVRFYADHPCTWTRPYPGASETLAGLSARGVALAVLSNKPAAIARRVVDHLGLGRHLWHVWGGDSFPRRKPAPDGILHFLEELRLTPREACLVGDLAVDLECAAAAGAWSCFFTGGYGDETALAAPADFRIHSLPELIELAAAPTSL